MDGHMESIMKRLVFAVIIIVAFATYAIQTVGQTSISTAGFIGFLPQRGSWRRLALVMRCVPRLRPGQVALGRRG